MAVLLFGDLLSCPEYRRGARRWALRGAEKSCGSASAVMPHGMGQTTDGVRSSPQLPACGRSSSVAAMRDMHDLESVSWRRGRAARHPDSTSCAASASRPISAAWGAPRCACTSRSRRCPSAWPRSRPRSERGCSSARARGVALTPAGRRLYRARAPAAGGRRPGRRGDGRHPPDRRRRAPGRQPLGDRGVRRGAAGRAQRAPAARRRAGDRQLAGRARAGRRRPGRRRRGRVAARPHAQPGRARDRARRRRDRLRGSARPPLGRARHA